MTRCSLGLTAAGLLLVAACGGGGGGPPAPTITVSAPNGGEAWTIGAPETVTWTSSGLTGNVDIEYSTNGGATWTTLAANTANDGTESVTVPAAVSSTVRVQVSAADGNPAVALAPSDRSDSVFRIGGPPVDIEAGLPGVHFSSLAWGDYDNDGDLDLALAGTLNGGGVTTRIYRNDTGTFTDIGAGLPAVVECSLAWGDYDNDGDLDLALAGFDEIWIRITRIYRNDAGTFADIAAGLPGVGACSIAWGDYDNDGDLDLALAGDVETGWITRIYRNDGGTFADIAAGLEGANNCSLAWGDYDNDGDLDLARVGGGPSGRSTRIYRNDGGTFADIGASLPEVTLASVAWGDYDNDGDLDLALAGARGGSPVAGIFRNDTGTFTDIGAGLLGVERCSLAWGDYDNDGDLDLALAGAAEGAERSLTRIYRSDAGTFTDIAAGLLGVEACSIAWGDYDNDGDLDLAVAGYGQVPGSDTRIYRNDGGFAPNTPPAAPTGLAAIAGGGAVLLSWLAADDVETPSEGLSYNLRIGKTTTDDGDYPSMADGLGVRRIPARGPIAHNPLFVSAWLELPPGVYYASVQAVDTSMEGGPWSTPVPFSIP